jgi:hypothetical protein
MCPDPSDPSNTDSSRLAKALEAAGLINDPAPTEDERDQHQSDMERYRRTLARINEEARREGVLMELQQRFKEKPREDIQST